MHRKKEKQINVIAYLSTDGNMYSTPVKEKKQYQFSWQMLIIRLV